MVFWAAVRAVVHAVTILCLSSILAAPLTAETSWRFVASGRIVTSPVVLDSGEVSFAADDRNLYRLSAGGELRWRTRLPEMPTRRLTALHDGSVLIELSDGRVERISRSGRHAWTLRSPDEKLTSIAASNLGIVYLTYEGGGIRALNYAGHSLWALSVGDSVVHGPYISGDGSLVLITEGAELLVLTSDGTVVDSYDIEEVPAVAAMGPDGTVVAADEHGRISRINITDGTREVIAEANSAVQRLILDTSGALSFVDETGELHGATTSQPLTQVDGGAAGTGDGGFVVSEESGVLRVLDDAGETVVHMHVGGGGALGEPVIGAGGHIVVPGRDEGWIVYGLKIEPVRAPAWTASGGSARNDGRIYEVAMPGRRELRNRRDYLVLSDMIRAGGASESERVLSDVEARLDDGNLRGTLAWISSLLIEITGIDVSSRESRLVSPDIAARAYVALGRVGDLIALRGLERAASRANDPTELRAIMRGFSSVGFSDRIPRGVLISEIYDRGGGPGTSAGMDEAFISASEELWEQGARLPRVLVETLSYLPQRGASEQVRMRARALLARVAIENQPVIRTALQ